MCVYNNDASMTIACCTLRNFYIQKQLTLASRSADNKCQELDPTVDSTRLQHA